MSESDQQAFDRKYITSTEICQKLKISRGTIVNARKRGQLPPPIKLQQIFLWDRDTVSPIIAKWALDLDIRRGVVNG